MSKRCQLKIFLLLQGFFRRFLYFSVFTFNKMFLYYSDLRQIKNRRRETPAPVLTVYAVYAAYTAFLFK